MSLFNIFRIVAVSEALSWVGLLSGMYVKYLGSGNEVGVQLFGAIHGALFVAFCACVLLLARENDWPNRTILLGLATGVPPLATLWFERHASRRLPVNRAPRPADR